MYKRTVYLVFGKKYLAFGKGKKSQVMKRGPKSQLKKIHIAQLQTLFPKHLIFYSIELWLIQSEGSLHGLNSVCP